MGGLSIATNLLSSNVALELHRNQSGLQQSASRLSSGLRVETSADDPSGFAIAANLTTQVSAFNQSASNVQNANSALAVADGALAATTAILQRIRSLAVEAAVDTASAGDRANVQAEIEQLLAEVSRISQNTHFNGTALLDGSHAGFQPSSAATITITANAALAQQGSSSTPIANGTFENVAPSVPINGSVATPAIAGWTIGGNYTVYNGTGGVPAGPPGVNVLSLNDIGGPGSAQTTITGLDPNQTYTISFLGADIGGTFAHVFVNGSLVDPTGFAAIGPSFQTWTTQTFTASAAGTADLQINVLNKNLELTNFVITPTFTPAGINYNLLAASVVASNANFNTTVGGAFAYNAAGTYATIDGTLALTVINTGVSVAVQETFINSATGAVSVDPILYGALQTSSDFENVAITIGSISTADVGVSSYIKIGQNVAALTNPVNPALSIHAGAQEGDTLNVGIAATNAQTLRIANINVAITAPSNPSLGAQDAIGQIDIALANLLSERAQIGALLVQLHAEIENDTVAAVSLQASESSIRDLNVGQETTNFTRLQILVQTGDTLLSQSNLQGASVLSLFR